jgi:photosystem II stability/assembly factor-like uncharacterized protein
METVSSNASKATLSHHSKMQTMKKNRTPLHSGKGIQSWLITAVVLLFINPAVFAQRIPDMTEQTTYEEVKNYYDSYWQDRTPTKSSGWKQLKRSEWFWQYRTMPDGTFPPAGQNQAEYEYFSERYGSLEKSLTSNWTNLGPFSSNANSPGIGRITSVAFHPTNPGVIWAGTPGGGLWRTVNGGAVWVPLTDNMPNTLGISDVVVHPTNPNILYISTGDAVGGAIAGPSTGVLRSTDGGATWNTTGLSFNLNNHIRIFRLIINPSNPNILLAATNIGIYRTTNGGTNWTRVTTEFTYDLKFRPGNTNIVYACNQDRLFRSVNGGTSFTQVQVIPNSIRLAMAVTPANPDMVAVVSAGNENGFNGYNGFNGVYTSFNSGQTYTLRSSMPNLLHWAFDGVGSGGQGWYDLCITISPTNANAVFVGGVNLWRSLNGGASWTLINKWHPSSQAQGVAVVHADKHYLGWQNNNTLFQGCDGGIHRSTDNGTTWTDLTNTMAIGQIYRIGVSQADNRVICGLQDNGTKLRGITNQWTSPLGGDGMDCAIHPTNPNIMYGSIQEGELHRSTNGGQQFTHILSRPGEGAWVTPIALAPNGTLFAGYRDVWRTTNQGANWTNISHNLSPNTPLTSLAVAATNINVIYAANDFTVFRTTNGGGNWQTVFTRPTGTWISSIQISPNDANRVYITLSGYVAGQKVFRSTNGGANWANISGALPNLPANCIVERSGSNQTLFIGMDVGIYTRDAADTNWVLFNTNLPNAPIMDLEIRNSTNTLRAATFGRGLWETPIINSTAVCNTPSNLTTTDISCTTNTAKFNWTVVDGATAYNIQTRTGTGAWNTLSGAPFTGNSLTVSSVVPNTTYEWRIQSICIGGNTSAWSNGISFSGPPTCGAPAGLNTSNVTQVTATLNWNTVPCATGYIVQGWNGNQWVNWSPTITTNSFSVYGLLANRTYHWRVIAVCPGGNNQASPFHTFSTQSAPDCTIGTQFPWFALNPTSSWQYQDWIYGGEYCLVNVQVGQVYTFSYCSSDGGALAFDGELSIRTVNNQLIMYSDDVCGVAPRLVWRAGFTGQVRVLLTRYSCSTQGINSRMAYRVGGNAFTDDDPVLMMAAGGNNNSSDTNPAPAISLQADLEKEAKKSDAAPDTAGALPGYVSSSTVTVEKMEEQPLDRKLSIHLWPNPTQGLITMVLKDAPDEEAVARVFNLQGRLILTQTFRETVQIDLSGHPPGQYLVRVSCADIHETTRVVKL